MASGASRLHGLVVLEGILKEQALVALELRNPQYVAAFRRTIHLGPVEAMNAARPFLGSQPWWYELLTGLLSVELVMDEVKTALSLMRSHRAEGRDDGRLLDYHRNHWIFQTHALLEKSVYLVKRVYRTLVMRLDPDSFRERSHRTTARLEELRKRYARLRDPIVHPKGGPVTGVEEERLWETFVLTGATGADAIDGQCDGLPGWRERWCEQNRILTAIVLDAIDAAFVQAARDATTINTTP